MLPLQAMSPPATAGLYEMTTPEAYKFDVHTGDLSNMMELAVPAAAQSIATLDEHGQVTDSGVREEITRVK